MNISLKMDFLRCLFFKRVNKQKGHCMKKEVYLIVIVN